VRPDPRTQPPRLGDQLLARHRFEILVHDTSLPSRAKRPVLRGVCRTRIRQFCPIAQSLRFPVTQLVDLGSKARRIRRQGQATFLVRLV
jgi:hypothetical protein